MHICTPNHLHLPLAEAALAAGKHVICEKPLALDAAGARRLVEAAAGSGLQAAVPFVYRYYPTVREARQRVRDASTGALRLLHGAYLQDWLLRPEDDNWRVDEALGGRSRAFADIGSHWCDLAQFISGHRITRLSARLLTAVPERLSVEGRRAFAAADGSGDPRAVATEDAAVVLFETDAGALGTVTVSQISAGRKNKLWIELDGAESALCVRPGEPRGAVVRAARGGDDRATRPGAHVAGRGALRDAACRSSAGLRGLLRRVRRRRLRRDRGRGAVGRAAGFRGRPARRADHRRRARVGRERDWVDVAGGVGDARPGARAVAR